MKEKHTKLKKFLVSLGFMLLLFLIYYGLANIALHYVMMAVRTLFRSVRMEASEISFAFKIEYLIKPPAGTIEFLPVLLALMGCVFTGRKLIMKITSRIFRDNEIEGNSRWASKREIRKMSSKIAKSNFERQELTAEDEETMLKQIAVWRIPQANLILASDKKYYYMDKKASHTLVIGETQTGKTQLVVLNLIMAKARAGEHMIINDMKGELLRCTYQMLMELGYDVQVINLRYPANSSRYNPLEPIKEAYLEAVQTDGDMSKTIELTDDYTRIITENIHSDPIWPESAQALLTSIILYMLEDGYQKKCLDKLNMYSVFNFFIEFGGCSITIGKQTVNALDMLMSNLPVGHPAKISYATSRFAQGEMRSSIFATLSQSLKMFSDTGIAQITSGSDLNFLKNLKEDKPCAVFLVVPDEKKSRYKLVTTIIHQLYTQMVDVSYTQPGQRLKRPVSFILDEFGRMKYPDMEAKITVGLSRRILFYLFIQNLEQLNTRYGKSEASIISRSCNNLIYITSADESTNKYIEYRLGKRTATYEDYTRESGEILASRQSSHTKGRSLLDATQLTRLQEGEVITIKLRENPIFTKLDHFYKLGYPQTDLKTLNLAKTKINLDEIMYPFNVNEYIEKMKPAEIETEPAEEKKLVKLPAGKEQLISLQNIFDQCNLHTKGGFGKAIQERKIMQLQMIAKDLLSKKLITDKEMHMIQNIFIRDLQKEKIKVY